MTSGSDAERDALDKLVARLDDGDYSNISEVIDAITQLRQRVEELEKRIPTAAVAAMQDGFKEAIDKRDRRIAELEETLAISETIGGENITAKTVAEMTLATMQERIAEALEYCSDREDIIDGDSGPRPNDFMQIATILKGRVA